MRKDREETQWWKRSIARLLCASEGFERVHLLTDFARADLPCKFHDNPNVCSVLLNTSDEKGLWGCTCVSKDMFGKEEVRTGRTKASGSILTLVYCVCSVSYALRIFVWFSSGFSGFLPSPKNMLMDWLHWIDPWHEGVCERECAWRPAMRWTCVPCRVFFFLCSRDRLLIHHDHDKVDNWKINKWMILSIDY